MTPLVVIGAVPIFAIGLLALLRRFHRSSSASSPTSNLPAVSEAESPRILSSILSLSAYLLESNDERAVLRAAMRAGCEILDAEGALFLPFGEFLPSLPALEFGRTPAFASFNYDDRLTNPATRQRCKACGLRRGGPDCILLRQEKCADYFNYCIPLHWNGREAGLFSFVFHAPLQVNAETHKLLEESFRLVELALDAFRWRVPATPPPPHPSADLRLSSTEIEARAILDERARLAREIHDGLAQTLAFLKIEVGRAEKFLAQGKPESAAGILNDTSRTLSDAYLDARQAIEGLRRIPDDRLESWLRQVAEDFEALTGLCVDVDLSSLPAIPLNVQVQMIRIVQEALTNVRKHAQAKQVKISAWEREGDAFIEVRDDGLGFAPANPIAAARFGLRGMRERAEIVGADLQVASQPGKGVTVRLRLPITEGAQS